MSKSATGKSKPSGAKTTTLPSWKAEAGPATLCYWNRGTEFPFLVKPAMDSFAKPSAKIGDTEKITRLIGFYIRKRILAKLGASRMAF